MLFRDRLLIMTEYIAINYSLSQWDKMAVYLESLYLMPDSNVCENAALLNIS